jgi:hypothetical protein
MIKHPRIWVDSSGKTLTLEECSKEQLIARFRCVVDRNQEDRIKQNKKMDKLNIRLRNHRKAKALANKRADAAVRAMKTIFQEFNGTVPS